jgi:hypothetical protein
MPKQIQKSWFDYDTYRNRGVYKRCWWYWYGYRVFYEAGVKKVTQTTPQKNLTAQHDIPPRGMTQTDWDRFKKGLCWAESSPDCPCCDDKVGASDDVGRYQTTPIQVADIYQYYCKDCRSDRCKKGCTDLLAICPKAKDSDSSCAKDQAVSDKLLELWSNGRWYPHIERQPNETDWHYYHRIIGIWHCGRPSRTSCAEYGPIPPLTVPGQNYFVKF